MVNQSRGPAVIVLTGPGGAGKNTLRDAMLERLPNLITAQKLTTRPKRPGDHDEFRFVSEEEFKQFEDQGVFFETIRFGGHAYGTPREGIDQALGAGRSVIMIYDAAGARTVRRHYPNQSIWIFVTAPEADLRKRMATRGDSPQRIEERLRLAPLRETPQSDEADLKITNPDGQLEQTAETIVQFLTNRLG